MEHPIVSQFDDPVAVRLACRTGRLDGPTTGMAPGRLQGNLAILPAALADDFLRFCVRNPKPCPILAVSEPGDPSLPRLGVDLDIRTDAPRYRLFHDGLPGESVADLTPHWRDDLVAFVIGCSFSFEDALVRAGIPVRHIDAKRNVPMYRSSIETEASGPFGGPMVVSMRAFKPKDAIAATILSARMAEAHGAPVHIGDPAAIGIADVTKPDYGDAPVIEPGDICVFWACGVTPQSAIARARPAFAITHEPGHMLVTDQLADLPR